MQVQSSLRMKIVHAPKHLELDHVQLDIASQPASFLAALFIHSSFATYRYSIGTLHKL